jgi:hypothetical protein
VTLDAVHMSVPRLRVSPLALPPPALRLEGVVSMDDCESCDEEETTDYWFIDMI